MSRNPNAGGHLYWDYSCWPDKHAGATRSDEYAPIHSVILRLCTLLRGRDGSGGSVASPMLPRKNFEQAMVSLWTYSESSNGQNREERVASRLVLSPIIHSAKWVSGALGGEGWIVRACKKSPITRCSIRKLHTPRIQMCWIWQHVSAWGSWDVLSTMVREIFIFLYGISSQVHWIFWGTQDFILHLLAISQIFLALPCPCWKPW